MKNKLFVSVLINVIVLLLLVSSFVKDYTVEKESVSKIDTIYIQRHITIADTLYDMSKYRNAIGMIESGNNYTKRRPKSQYWGKYQIGKDEREYLGLKNISWEQFKKNPELQDAAFDLLVATTREKFINHITEDGDTINYLKIYSNIVINHHYITESGIVSMAHIAGVTGTKKFLKSFGKIKPKDGFGTQASSYLSLSNYNINIPVEQAQQKLNEILKTIN